MLRGAACRNLWVRVQACGTLGRAQRAGTEVRCTHKCEVHVRVSAGRLSPAVCVWGLGMARLGLGHVRWSAMQLKQRTSVRESVTCLSEQDRKLCNPWLSHKEQAIVLWCCVSAWNLG